MQKASQLLQDHLSLLAVLDHSVPVLDLACGTGRDGLFLAAQGIPVVFADKSASALQTVEQHVAEAGLSGRTWQIDLELPEANPFQSKSFSAIIGFRYLHRPLFPALRGAIQAGGLIIYETFTVDNRQFGRPNNPDFLLRTGELKSIFSDWDIVHDFEGVLQNPERAVAQIVARKPPSGQ